MSNIENDRYIEYLIENYGEAVVIGFLNEGMSLDEIEEEIQKELKKQDEEDHE
jgi:hypothetical protein